MAPLVVVPVLIGSGPGAVSASVRGPWVRVAMPSPGSATNTLSSVAVLSPHLAWAVGGYSSLGAERTLIEHWDGTSWTHVPSPNPQGYDLSLNGVAATSAANAWAVGSTGYQPLIEHWDGTAWRRVATPDIGGFTQSMPG